MANSTVTALGQVTVLRPDGSEVLLGAFWEEQPVLLAMIRHFGCIFCKEQVGRLREYVPRIHAAGGELVVLGNGQAVHAQWFVEDFKMTTPVVTDPDLKSHAVVGAKKQKKVPDPRLLIRGAKAFLKGYRQTKTMGYAGMLGGVFVITPEGEMPFRHLSDFAGDHPEPEIVVRALEKAAASRKPKAESSK